MKFYVDRMRHLVCVPYSVENLHRMAEFLGLNKCWFHNQSYAHYDIPKRRVAEFLDHCDVQVVSPREILRICKGEQ